MAISFDAASTGDATDTTLTFAHTCTGTRRLLVVGVGIEDADDEISGVTYNGVAMTLVDKIVNGVPNEWTYMFYLLNPSSGTNNVVVTASSSTTIRGLGVSYTGVLQSGQPDSKNEATAQGASHALSTTTVLDNSWVVGMAQGDDATPGAGTGVTSRATVGGSRIGDSNGPKTPAGSYSMTFTGGASTRINIEMASFSPSLESDVVGEVQGYFDV